MDTSRLGLRSFAQSLRYLSPRNAPTPRRVSARERGPACLAIMLRCTAAPILLPTWREKLRTKSRLEAASQALLSLPLLCCSHGGG
jgi:hypothetical protein